MNQKQFGQIKEAIEDIKRGCDKLEIMIDICDRENRQKYAKRVTNREKWTSA